MRVLACLLALAWPAPGNAASHPWTRFTAVLWHSDLPPAALASLPGLGITAGRVFGQRDGFDPAALQAAMATLRKADLGAVIENVATDFYAPYHRWRPDRPVNAAFLDLLARHAASPGDPALWRREPGLADAAALAAIERRLAAHAAAAARDPALYLSLGDETGIADLSAAWDFDENPAALRAWRGWLVGRSGNLRALNRAWHTRFPRWSAVCPTRTDQALDGTAPRAAWMAFKAWMDLAFARALARGTAAAHRGDPRARAGIEGVQRPGWGGYDFATLAPAVDVLEIGSVGTDFALARAFHPGAVLLTTSAAADQAEAQRLWRSVLLGGRGAILWDPDGEIMRPDGRPGPRGLALARLLEGLRGPLGTRLLRARPTRGTVGIVHSQTSFRLRWLLDRQAELAQDWTRRSNDTDLADSPWRSALDQVSAALPHLGRTPDWIDEAALTPSRLAGLRVVLLPQAIALDDRAVAALRGFAQHGGRILADAPPGAYDALGRRRAHAPLAGIARLVPRLDTATLRRALPGSARVTTFEGQPIPDVSLFRLDAGRLLAVQRDAPGPAEDAVLVLPQGRRPIRLDPALPTIVALSPGLPGRRPTTGGRGASG